MLLKTSEEYTKEEKFALNNFEMKTDPRSSEAIYALA